jgi:nucleoid DNA-binding protein
MPRPNKLMNEIILEIVQEDGGTYEEVSEVVMSQFSFVKRHIEKGEFSTIRLPYLGKFYVKPGRLSKLNHAVIQRRKL